MVTELQTSCATLQQDSYHETPEVVQRDPYNHAVDWWSLGVIACYMLTGEFPSPAINIEKTQETQSSTINTNMTMMMNNRNKELQDNQPTPGSLPKSANKLSKGARALLMRLLETDPKLRMRSLRQLQQTAFYMGFNFENIKVKKILPKSILESYDLPTPTNTENEFIEFDQLALMSL